MIYSRSEKNIFSFNGESKEKKIKENIARLR